MLINYRYTTEALGKQYPRLRMKVKLNIAERLSIVDILPIQGNYITIKTINRLRDLLLPDSKEVKKYNLIQEGNQIKWDSRYDNETKEYELDEFECEIIKRQLIELDKSEKLTPNLIKLYERFVKND